MGKNGLLILFAIGLVLMIYVIRYVINRIVHAGADAIGNKIKQARSQKHPAQDQSLAQRLGASQQNAQADPAQNSIREAESRQTSAAASDSVCVACGAPLKPGSTFCGKCGTQLKKN